MTMKKIIILLSVALIALAGTYYYNENQNLNNEPPKIIEKSDLLGFLQGDADTLSDLDETFICTDENKELVAQSDNYTVLYNNQDRPFSDFLSRIESSEGKFRFISFVNNNSDEGFLVSPFSFFESKFVLDIEDEGYCCLEMDKQSVIKKGTLVLLFSDKEFNICKNPSLESMASTENQISTKGWHLNYIASNNNLKLDSSLEIESVWSFPANAENDSQLLWSKDQTDEFLFNNDIYWLHIIDKEADSGSTGGDAGNTGGDTGNTGGDTGNTGGDTGSTGGDAGNTGGDTGATAELPTNFDISANNMAFSETELRFKSGEEITINFVNNDSAPHNFVISNTEIQTEILNNGETATLTFTAPASGNYEAICTLHPSMKVTIVIE